MHRIWRISLCDDSIIGTAVRYRFWCYLWIRVIAAPVVALCAAGVCFYPGRGGPRGHDGMAMDLARFYRERFCPCCGLSLNFTPRENGVGSEMPCPCCGIHFGGVIWTKLAAKWCTCISGSAGSPTANAGVAANPCRPVAIRMSSLSDGSA